VARWVERVLHVLPVEPRPESYNPLGKKNLAPKWVARLGSQSYGNAVVAQGRVLVGTNNEPPRDPQHQGDRSILLWYQPAQMTMIGT